MKLFVGLGNPGDKYENHRHNIGFMAVDEIVRRHNFLPEIGPGIGTGKKRWQALTHEGRLGREKVVIIKPQTYMNESGRSVGDAMRFFKLAPEDVIVFYDELDVAFGKIKAKKGGGSAGHNGIKSITAHIGPDFERVRMGIGHPGDKARVHGHVLGDFAKSELDGRDAMIDAVAAEAPWLADGDRPRFLAEVARHLNPVRDAKTPKTASGAAQKPGKTAQTNKEQGATGPMASALKALADKLKRTE